MVDLDSYFKRIHYRGPRTATLETLNELARHHVLTIPFENLDVLLAKPISLEPDAVDQKLIVDGRGGYCFEQNTLFLRVLLELGFDARPLSARVRLDRPRDYTPARTHVFVRVELAGKSFLADVGVGALAPTCALDLFSKDEQPTPHETRRIVFEDGRYFHQALLKQGWADVCEFTLEEMPEIDREVANWFTSASPKSHFKARLVVARGLEDGGRISILNTNLTRRLRGGESIVTALPSHAALMDALATHFDLHFPEGTRIECPALIFPQSQ